MREANTLPGAHFCSVHDETIGKNAELRAVVDASHIVVSELARTMNLHLQEGNNAHPWLNARLAALEVGREESMKWQAAQTKTTQATAATLAAIQTALATKAEERIGKLDRGTKVLVAWLALGGTALASLIVTAGQILIALYK